MLLKTKDLIPPGKVDWFNNTIPAPDAFEEGNMATLTIKVDLSVTSGVVENITLGADCSSEEVAAYKERGTSRLPDLIRARLCSNNSAMFLPGFTPSCLEWIQLLLNTVLILDRMQSQCGRNNGLFILPRLLPLKRRN